MKLYSVNLKSQKYWVAIILSCLASYAEAAVEPVLNPQNEVYLSLFAGAGSSNGTSVSQYGTAFYAEAVGGPLAVNAFGNTGSRSLGLGGGNLGYQWMDFFWFLSPAVELEAYYLGNSSFNGDISNGTSRLPEHNFNVNYPLRTGIFLINGVLNFNLAHLNSLHPYIGLGIGGGVLSITDANALQVAPPEPGVNHYNSNPNDLDATFTGQIKVGLNYDLSAHISVFGEYRMLYISTSNFAFGSTVAPGHVATSNWQVELNPQYYNMGSVGIQFSI